MNSGCYFVVLAMTDPGTQIVAIFHLLSADLLSYYFLSVLNFYIFSRKMNRFFLQTDEGIQFFSIATVVRK